MIAWLTLTTRDSAGHLSVQAVIDSSVILPPADSTPGGGSFNRTPLSFTFSAHDFVVTSTTGDNLWQERIDAVTLPEDILRMPRGRSAKRPPAPQGDSLTVRHILPALGAWRTEEVRLRRQVFAGNGATSEEAIDSRGSLHDGTTEDLWTTWRRSRYLIGWGSDDLPEAATGVTISRSYFQPLDTYRSLSLVSLITTRVVRLHP